MQRRLAEIGEARRRARRRAGNRHGAGQFHGQSSDRRSDAFPVLAYAASIAGLLVAGAFGVRAIRQLMLKPERVDIGLANDEFIPSTHSSELALSNDGTLIAYASSKRMAGMPKMDSGSDGAGDSGQTDDIERGECPRWP